LAGVLAAWLIYAAFLKPDLESVTEVTYREEIKYNVKDTTITRYRDSLRLNVVSTAPSKDPEKYDSIRSYEGHIKLDYGVLKWKAETFGELSKIEFSPTLVIPEKTITATTSTTKANVTKALYAGGGVSSTLDFSAGVYYLNRDKLIGYEFDPVRKTHSVKIALKIFGK
jgi:hypothetical protein